MAKWRRGGGRQDNSRQALAWNSQGVDMAIAGGVTAAYRCQVVDGWLRVKYAPMPRGHCADTVEQAVELLQGGHQVIVAGADMAALRTALAGSGVGTAGG